MICSSAVTFELWTSQSLPARWRVVKEAARYLGLVVGEVCLWGCLFNSLQPKLNQMFVGFKNTGFIILCIREKKEHRKLEYLLKGHQKEHTGFKVWFSKALRKQDNSTMRYLVSLMVIFLFLWRKKIGEVLAFCFALFYCVMVSSWSMLGYIL